MNIASLTSHTYIKTQQALFANDASKPTGAFSVSLVDPTQPALPVTHAHVRISS